MGGDDRASEMQPGADVCANYLKALGDPCRLKIVRALQGGPMSVSDLAMLLESEVPNVSHHLRVLFHAGLVKTERDGRFIYYELNRELFASGRLKRSLDFGCCKLDLGS